MFWGQNFNLLITPPQNYQNHAWVLKKGPVNKQISIWMVWGKMQSAYYTLSKPWVPKKGPVNKQIQFGWFCGKMQSAYYTPPRIIKTMHGSSEKDL